MKDEPLKIHITRKGQQFGPYPEDIAKQYLDESTLLKTDLAWHDGAEGWEPLGKLLAAEEETKTAEPPTCMPAPVATAPPEVKSTAQLTGFATYSPYDEEMQKSTQFMTLGILAIVGVVLPTVIFSPSFKIHFPNFDLGGKSAENIITMIGPLIVGITLAAMAKTAKDPMRCSVALGLSLVLLIILFSIEGDGDFGPKLSSCVTLTIELIKMLTHDGGLYLVPALAGSCLLIGSAAKAR